MSPHEYAEQLAKQIEERGRLVQAATKELLSSLRRGTAVRHALEQAVGSAGRAVNELLVLVNGVVTTFPDVRALLEAGQDRLRSLAHDDPYGPDLEYATEAFDAAVQLLHRERDRVAAVGRALGPRCADRQARLMLGLWVIDELMFIDEDAPDEDLTEADEALVTAIAAELARIGREHVDDVRSTLGIRSAPAFSIEALESRSDEVGTEPRDREVFSKFVE